MSVLDMPGFRAVLPSLWPLCSFPHLPWCSSNCGNDATVVTARAEPNDSKVTLSKPQVSSLITIHDKKKILWLRLWTGLLYQQEASNLGCQYAHLAKQKFTWKPLGSPAMALHQPTAPGTNFHTGNELRSKLPTFTDAARIGNGSFII